MRNVMLLLLAALPLAAQTHSPYTAAQTRDIKAVSDEEARKLREGAGMGLAIAAELNGYPGPKHVLELAAQLELSAEQREAVQRIHDRMKVEAVKLGEEILEAERKLDRAFASSSIDDAALATTTAQIATLQGRLRYTHLTAHLETRALLSKHQNVMYGKLRGYGTQAGHSHHH